MYCTSVKPCAYGSKLLLHMNILFMYKQLWPKMYIYEVYIYAPLKYVQKFGILLRLLSNGLYYVNWNTQSLTPECILMFYLIFDPVSVFGNTKKVITHVSHTVMKCDIIIVPQHFMKEAFCMLILYFTVTSCSVFYSFLFEQVMKNSTSLDTFTISLLLICVSHTREFTDCSWLDIYKYIRYNVQKQTNRTDSLTHSLLWQACRNRSFIDLCLKHLPPTAHSFIEGPGVLDEC